MPAPVQMANRKKTAPCTDMEHLLASWAAELSRCWVILPERESYQTVINSTLSLPGAAPPDFYRVSPGAFKLEPRKEKYSWVSTSNTLSPCLGVTAHSSLTSVPALLALSINWLSQINSVSLNIAYLETFGHLAPSNNSMYLQWHALVFTSFRKQHAEQRKGLVHNQVSLLYRTKSQLWCP